MDEAEPCTSGDSFIDIGKTMHLRSENARKAESLVMMLSYVIRVEDANVQLAVYQ